MLFGYIMKIFWRQLVSELLEHNYHKHHVLLLCSKLDQSTIEGLEYTGNVLIDNLHHPAQSRSLLLSNLEFPFCHLCYRMPLI